MADGGEIFGGELRSSLLKLIKYKFAKIPKRGYFSNTMTKETMGGILVANCK